MPKVIGYTPAWLTRPSPGASIFSDPEPHSPRPHFKSSSTQRPTPTPEADSNVSPSATRLLARRGSEVFTVVGNKLRWADLSRVKNEWEDATYKPGRRLNGRSPEEEHEAVYRTLITPVYYQITQLVLSPSGFFLAICTEHTVHIAALPDSARLQDRDPSPLKLKTYQLGPTTHVIPEAPLASVAWHPLAVSTNTSDCLVTVTKAAAVRVWEFDRTNHWSFEQPALAIDLRKLADGTSSDQDFEPSAFGKNRGFCVDEVDMDTCAACFGGSGAVDEDPWASMTLWTAMSSGDIYALCPLLPSKWQPSTTAVAALTVSAVARMASTPTLDGDPEERRACEQQYEWVQELDAADAIDDGYPELQQEHIRRRPRNLAAIPRLQGPFDLISNELSDEVSVTDIHVIAARLDEESLLSGEDDYDVTEDARGLPFTTVCLGFTNQQVDIMVDLHGVTGQWLPKRSKNTFTVPDSEVGELILLESVKVNGTSRSLETEGWPGFTLDDSHPYNFFVNSGHSVFSMSLADWATRLGTEASVADDINTGLHTRLALACQGTICVQEKILQVDQQDASPSQSQPTRPVLIEDVSIGRLLLTFAMDRVFAAQYDQKDWDVAALLTSQNRETSQSPLHLSRSLARVLATTQDEDVGAIPTRAPYAPPRSLYQNQMQPYEELKLKIPGPRKPVLTERPLKLSAACLDVMTTAHRTFSQQTATIERAAAELFRRCERLRSELTDQVRQMSELADRLQHLRDSDDDDDGRPLTKSSSLEQRMQNVQTRQSDLVRRYETLRRKAGGLSNAKQELSSREKSWIEEIDGLGRHVGVTDECLDGGVSAPTPTLKQRYETASTLARELLPGAKKLDSESSSPAQPVVPGLQRSDSSASHRSGFSVSSRLQRERIADVMSMVERESAVIDAVMSRLNRLSVG